MNWWLVVFLPYALLLGAVVFDKWLSDRRSLRARPQPDINTTTTKGE